jgi:hypothetical protein
MDGLEGDEWHGVEQNDDGEFAPLHPKF